MESLAQYQTLNSSSVIYELFQGQLRSMLTCRFCKNDSKTFDPYLCLSLPVPFRLKYTIFVRAIFHETNSLVSQCNELFDFYEISILCLGFVWNIN